MARTLRLLFAFLTITIVTVALAGKLYAADWPVKPVTVIVPFGAGGNTDMMARIAAQRLSAKFGQSFVVENRPKRRRCTRHRTSRGFSARWIHLVVRGLLDDRTDAAIAETQLRSDETADLSPIWAPGRR